MNDLLDSQPDTIDNRVLFGIEKLVDKYKIKEDSIEDIKPEVPLTPKENVDTISYHKQEEQLKDSIQNLINNTVEFDFDKFSDRHDNKSQGSRKSHKWSIGSRNSNKEQLNFTEKPVEFNPTIYPENNTPPSVPPVPPTDNTSTKEKEYIKPINKYNEKIKLLRDWEYITKKYPTHTFEKFDIDSEYDEIKVAIDRIKYSKSRETFNDRMKDGVLMATTGLEKFVHKFNIFGYGESISGLSINMKKELYTFDDIFDELYDKYATSGRNQPPEIRLIINFIRIIALYMISQVATNMLNKHIDKEFKKSNTREMSPPEQDSETLELLEKYK